MVSFDAPWLVLGQESTTSKSSVSVSQSNVRGVTLFIFHLPDQTAAAASLKRTS